MALSCLLRGAPIKFRVSSLQSLTRSPLLPCSTAIGSSQLYHSIIAQPSLKTKQTLDKQNVPTIVANLPGPLTQQVQKFSLSAKNMSSQGHDHAKLWTIERAFAVGLLGVIPAAFLFPCAALDYLMATMVVMHNHWGWEAVLVDYVRPAIVGTVISKLAIVGCYAVSVATLAGLFFFIYNDVGIANCIKMLWKL